MVASLRSSFARLLPKGRKNVKTKIYKKINQAPDEFFKFLKIIFVLILRAKPDQRL